MEKNVHGGDIYGGEYRLDFSANLNPFGMPEAVREAACAGVGSAVNYPDTRWRELRGAIAGAEQVEPEWIVCGNGAAELIFALCYAKRPKRALLTAPGFAEYEQALRQAGCEIAFYPCEEKKDFRVEEDFLDWIGPETEMVFLCNPANPTGLVVEPELMGRIAAQCERYDVLLVVDECFNGLMEDGERHTLRSLLREQRTLVLLKAFTKLYAMPGLRLGYLLCSDTAFLEQVRGAMQPWNVSIPAQMAGIAALRETEYVEESRRYIAREREALRQALTALGLRCYPSRANFLFFKGPAGLYKACRMEGILIRDCGNYRGLGDGYYRVAVRMQEENRELVRVLAREIAALQRKSGEGNA